MTMCPCYKLLYNQLWTVNSFFFQQNREAVARCLHLCVGCFPFHLLMFGKHGFATSRQRAPPVCSPLGIHTCDPVPSRLLCPGMEQPQHPNCQEYVSPANVACVQEQWRSHAGSDFNREKPLLHIHQCVPEEDNCLLVAPDACNLWHI